MALGPLEILVVGFPTERPGPEVVQALAATQMQGDLRVIEVVVLSKSPAGEVDVIDVAELDDVEDVAAHVVADDMLGLLADEDVAEVGQLLDPGTCAAAVLVEHVWARGLGQAVRDAGGELIAAVRIPHQNVEEAEAALAAAGASDDVD
jgi:uncharacterized membrane protein